MALELNFHQLQQLLIDRGILVPLYVYESIDSTNSEAFRLLQSTGQACIIVLSKFQTNGRGTNGRHWEDNRRQLSLSIGFKESLAPEQLSHLRIQFNQGFYHRLIQLYHADFTLKAPNDILLCGKKLSGLLLESKIEKGVTSAWVMGFGLNVYSGHQNYWSPEVQKTAIALQDAITQEIDINFLAAEFIQEAIKQHSTNMNLAPRQD